MTEHCAMCGGDTRILLKSVDSIFTRYLKQDFSLLQCRACSHVVTHPTPQQDALNQIYHSNYPYEAHWAIRKEKIRRAHHLLSLAPSFYSPGKTLLDLGCGDGSVMEVASMRGMDVTGVDLTEPEVRTRNSKFYKSSIDEFCATWEGKKFDVVVMSHSLEHLEDPSKAFDLISENVLSSRGVLLVAAPNSESWTRKLFGSRWGYWQVPVHIHHFSQNSLRILASRAGLSERKQRTRGADSLFMILTAMNCCRSKSTRISSLKLLFVRTFSAFMWVWIYIGTEDLMFAFVKNWTHGGYGTRPQASTASMFSEHLS